MWCSNNPEMKSHTLQLSQPSTPHSDPHLDPNTDPDAHHDPKAHCHHDLDLQSHPMTL